MQALDRYTRKLAAILFTDMVGYTAVMQRDEMLAIQMQKRHQATVDSCVKKFGGEVKNDMGDGSMSILPSAIQVIKCAMAIQEELRQEPRVNIRVGIHIADVLEEESGKVHGDGINIASRIETLGVAGAILFSKEVYNKIKNQPEFKTVLVGSFPFKNVEEPMDIYAIANEGFSVPTSQEALSAGKLKKPNQSTSFNRNIFNWPWTLILLVIGISFVLWYTFNSFKRYQLNLTSIVDSIKPIAVCSQSNNYLSNEKSVKLLAKDFNSGSSDNITPPESLKYSWTTNIADSILEVNCKIIKIVRTIEDSIIGNVMIFPFERKFDLWVTDLRGNQSSCGGYLAFFDTMNVCYSSLPQAWTGKVVHFDSRPAADVIIDINSGVALDTTGLDGGFEIYLPRSYNGQQVTLTLFYRDKLNLSHEIRLSGPEVLKTLKLKPEEK